MKKAILFLLAAFIILCSAVSCAKPQDKTESTTDGGSRAEPMDLSSLDLSAYVELGEYRGLEIEYTPDGASKGDAVWQKVVEGSTVKDYPKGQLDYYFEQSKARYEYLAKEGNESYENILEALGVTEETMLDEARALVREDLVFYALLKAENVVLSDSDKENHFERYVKKFVDDYGYTEAYVRGEMEEHIYQTMLFDKLLEKLVTLNTFKTSEER